MALDLQQERQQAHALLDQLPPAKLRAIRSLLAVMVNDDGELTEEIQRRLLEGKAYFDNGGQGIPMEEVLADFGLSMADFPLKK